MILDVTSQKTKQAIDKAVASFRAMLEKHRPEFPYQAFLRAIDSPGFESEQLALLLRFVVGETEMVVRPFKLDRTKTREQMISALGRKEYVDAGVLARMPTDGPDEGVMYFFRANRIVPVAEQPAELAKYGLVPHYLAQIQVNIDDPSFADSHPNGMQWEMNSYATFDLWNGERGVYARWSRYVWGDRWWFAGVGK